MIVRESLYFERGLDPKLAMNIGIEEQISNFLQERTTTGPSFWISYLLTEGDFDELDKETRKKWIEFLIRKLEYNNSLDDSDYYDLKKMGIEWIPYVPFSDSNFKYELIGNRYIIKFSDWSDFAKYFNTDSRDISEEFIEAVLSGDFFEYFDYSLENFRDITDFTYSIERLLNQGKSIPALKDLKEKALEMGANPDNVENISDLMNEIDSNNDLEDLKDTVAFAFAEASQSADESEAYKDIKKAITKYFDMGDAERKGEFFIAPITKEGVEKLSYVMASGEEKIIYYPPQSYDGDMTADDINDALDNKLSDL